MTVQRITAAARREQTARDAVEILESFAGDAALARTWIGEELADYIARYADRRAELGAALRGEG